MSTNLQANLQGAVYDVRVAADMLQDTDGDDFGLRLEALCAAQDKLLEVYAFTMKRYSP